MANRYLVMYLGLLTGVMQVGMASGTAIVGVVQDLLAYLLVPAGL